MPDTTAPRRGVSLGITAIILGILALIISWIPFIGAFGLPLSALGFLLAIIGLVVAMKGGAGIGYHIGGLAICGVAILLATCSTFVGTKTVQKVSESIQRGQATNQVTGTPSTQTDTSAAAANSTSVAPEQWADGTEPVRQGDVQVQVIAARIGKAAVIDIGGDASSSKDDLLTLKLRITNTSQNKKLEYKSWQGEDMSFGRDYADVTDENGNHYRRSTFGFATRLKGTVRRTSIYPGKSVEDVLVVEEPVESAKYIRLEIPASNFGGEGMLRIQIPSSFIKKPKTAAGSPSPAPPSVQNPGATRRAPVETDAALAEQGARVFDLTGRAMKGWILVGSRGTATAPALRRWVRIAVGYAESLPAKRQVPEAWRPLIALREAECCAPTGARTIVHFSCAGGRVAGAQRSHAAL